MKKVFALFLAVLFLWSLLFSSFAEVGYTVPSSTPAPASITVNMTGEPETQVVGLQVEPGSVGASVTISGTIEVKADSPDSTAAGVEVWGDNATVDVGGKIDVYAKEQADGVEFLGNKATVNVGGNIDVSADNRANGVFVSSGNGTVDIGGNIDVQAEQAVGVWSDPRDGEMKVTIQGDIHTEGSDATGISSHMHENASETFTVNGNITATGSESTDGVNIHMEAGSQVGLQVNGDIQSTSPEGCAGGVEIYADFDQAQSNADITGDITADGDNATGLLLDSFGDGTQNNLTLNGDLTVSAENDVRAVQSQAGRGQVNLIVNGDITAVGKTTTDEGASVLGLNIYSWDEDSQMSIELNGNLTAQGTENHSVTGISVHNAGGEQNLDVTGNISSTGTAIALEANYSDLDLQEGVQVPVNDNEYDPDLDCADAYYYYQEYYDLDEIPEGKDVNDVYHMYYNPEDQLYYMAKVGDTQSVITWKETIPTGEGAVNLTVQQENGDDAVVHGDEYGLLIENNNPGLTGDLLIDGVLSGNQAGVCVSETAVTDQMTLTVWKIETEEGNPIVGTKDSSGTVTENQDFAEQIQYIIRTEQPTEGGSFTLEGTQQYQGYDVAHMNDVVTLKITVQDGYEITGAYNGTDSPVSLQIGSDGNYYLTVPNGGGVNLSITLQKKSEAAPQTDNSSDAKSDTPATEESPDTEPAAPATAETEPVIRVSVVSEPEWITDQSVSAVDGVYSLSEAVSVPSGATVEIANLNQILPAEMIAALNKLTIDEQVFVLLSVLDADASVVFSQDMLDAAETIKAWFDSLTEAEKEAFLRSFRAAVEYNGREMEGYVFELNIRETDGSVTRKRLSFVELDGTLQLVKVEVHV